METHRADGRAVLFLALALLALLAHLASSALIPDNQYPPGTNYIISFHLVQSFASFIADGARSQTFGISHQ